jgi:hypothetical protein
MLGPVDEIRPRMLLYPFALGIIRDGEGGWL